MSKDIQWALELGLRADFLMQEQERVGVQFDQEKAKEVYKYCCDRMQEIEDEVHPHLPERDLNKGELKDTIPPKRQLRQCKEGYEPSSYLEKFYLKMDEYGIDIRDREIPLPLEPIITKGPMYLKHQAALKQWLQDSWGWKPTLWNFKKDSNNKFMRDEKNQLIKTSPKFHDKGELCPNLVKLGEVAEVIRPIIEWLSLRNRRSVILNEEKGTGWLSHPRLQQDGRLPSGSSGVTNTHRQKHSVVANIPRVSSLLGEEMRSLFRAPERKVLVGYDASGLEARVEAHWCFKYEGGKEYAEQLISGNSEDGTDIHTRNAEIFGCSRDIAKNGKYGLTYGAQAAKLGETLGVPFQRAQDLFNEFWENNTALAGFRDSLTRHWELHGKKGVKCPLTGYYLHSRSKHSLVNLVFQHTGAIIMDLSGIYMDSWLGGLKYDEDNLPYYLYEGYKVRRVIYYHDEYQWECDKEIAEEIGELGVRSIIKAGEYLQLNVPLDADYKIGKSWRDTH